jgi:hypothetical protein
LQEKMRVSSEQEISSVGAVFQIFGRRAQRLPAQTLAQSTK